ncbi:HAMP domain-containing sensor histidine kinase [Halarcobacter sp.]|uniref:sensor histidine kinase n=1 Tax=Halarcobacter sp. TaxID=2321133 RepID=UPI0029F5276F|nr:HAMP domain-containing sensor histidine kinase [Halarcobacter sp.]
MSLGNLAISYRCVNSIGNSLNLEEMLKDFIITFVKETDAIKGAFFKKTKDEYEEFICVGKRITSNLDEIKEKLEKEYVVKTKYNDDINILFYKLTRGCFVFFYDKNKDLDFNISVLKSLEKRLNISINSCLNVEKLKKRNEQLKEQKFQLEDLNKNLKDEINAATKANVDKERQIYEQLKMSQMGELIGNIAHQWRQPLNVISTAATGMMIKKEYNILEDTDFEEYTKSIVEQSKYLSNTIDEFRDYIKESHREKEIVIQDRLKMAIKMVESSFAMENIEIKEGVIESGKLHFRLVLGDLLQVLISIFNNAKDILVQNVEKNRWVKYELRKKEYTVLISIEDNGGGIKEEIKDKIFNPYFTTKHQSQGTGIGLYSAYDIVVNRLSGLLYVENTKEGAKFCIELPLNVNYVI